MKLILKKVRMSFNDIFEARSHDEGPRKFNGTFICLDGSDESGLETTITYTKTDGKRVTVPFAKMQDLCDYVAKELWGKVPAKLKNWAYNKGDGSGTREEMSNSDGDMWAGFDADTMYISASKKEDKCKDGKMTVIDQLKQPIIANSGKLFSGCYVHIVIDLYAFKSDKGGDCVTANLEGIQLFQTGEALGISQIDAADDFDEIEVEATDADDAASLM